MFHGAHLRSFSSFTIINLQIFGYIIWKKNIHRDIIKTNKSMYIKTSYKPSTVHACNTMILIKKKERDTVIPSISVLLQSVQ